MPSTRTREGKTRREVFLKEMELVVSCKGLLKVTEPSARWRVRLRASTLETLLRVHLMQDWLD